MKILAITLSFVISLTVFSQNNNNHLNLNSSKLAVDGYDLTTYFTKNKAVEGSKKYTTTYKGAVYRFVSSENKNLFDKNPTYYLPQYGGWCAYAMGEKNEEVGINPESFLITNNQLFLFYKTYFNDTKEKWNKDPKNLKSKADINWKNRTKK